MTTTTTPPLSARQAAVVEALSELTRDVVHLLIERDRIEVDPFTAALRRYRTLGEPKEVGGRWRQLLVRDDERRVLARLDRDLLDAVSPRRARVAVAPPIAITAAAIPAWPTTLVYAGPFDEAARVDALTERIRAIPGVADVSVEPSTDGMVWLHVAYRGSIPLGKRIGPDLWLAPIVIAGTPAPAAAAAEATAAA